MENSAPTVQSLSATSQRHKLTYDFSSMPQTTTVQDFQPLPTYTQSRISNDNWIAVTTVKTESDGTITQHSQIISKR